MKSAIEQMVSAGEALKKMAGNHRASFNDVMSAVKAWDEAHRLLKDEQAQKPVVKDSFTTEKAQKPGAPVGLVEELAAHADFLCDQAKDEALLIETHKEIK